MTMINHNENILSVMVEIDPYERLFTDQSRQHRLITYWKAKLRLCVQSHHLGQTRYDRSLSFKGWASTPRACAHGVRAL